MVEKPCFIREFQPADAEACFQIRVDAFLQKFHGHLGPNSVTVAVNAYMPFDYVSMAQTMPTLVAVDDGERIGFIVLQLTGKSAEIYFLYVRSDRTGTGVGSELVMAAENWIREHRSEIDRMTANTAVPRLNQPFYEKIGFAPYRESQQNSPDGPIRVVHLEKELRPL